MKYTLKGNLHGAICDDRLMPVANTTVRLYRFTGNANDATALTAAQAKETFQRLDEKGIEAKKKNLLAETKTDKAGNYSFIIDGNKTDYNGGVVEFDVHYSKIPDYGQKDTKAPKKFKSFQVTLNVLQPKWRETNTGLLAAWNYRISHKLWCAILAWLDIWVICGIVLNCETQQPLSGIDVTAMDDDWISDDTLGTATTNGNGRFCIFYRSKDFKKTFLSPIINVETPLLPWGNGPDIYFKFSFAGSSLGQDEDPSRARKADRENIGNCFCVTLCLKEKPNDEEGDPVAAFFSIGYLRRYHSILNIDPATGKTTGKVDPDWNNSAFYANLALLGTLTKKLNGNPMEYLFQYAEVANASDPIPTAPGAWSDVIPSQIANTVIGYRIELTPSPWPFPVFITKDYAIHANATQEPVSFNGNWIVVPQDSGFVPNVNGALLRLRSDKLSGGTANMAGLVAGKSTTAPPVSSPLQKNRYICLRMKKREAGAPGSEVIAGFSRPLAMCNTIYQNVPQRGSWLPTISHERGVACIDLAELAAAGGCSNIGNSLTANYTAANPNLGDVSLAMSGPGGPHNFDPVVFTTPGEEAHGAASYIGNVGNLPTCSYEVRISAELKLTNGEYQHDNIWDRVLFCK